MGLFLPSIPRAMPPRKQGIPRSSSAFLENAEITTVNVTESLQRLHSCHLNKTPGSNLAMSKVPDSIDWRWR